MENNIIRFSSFNGRDTVSVRVWPVPSKPKAVVQLIHGMCEHIDRYDEFAKFLQSHNIAVCGNDHVGHGRSITEGFKGDFGDTGVSTLIEDTHTIKLKMSNKYPNTPYIILGHSMGSFILRSYLTKYPEDVKAAILSGTCGDLPGLTDTLTKLRNAVKNGKGMEYDPNCLSDLFGTYTDRFDNVKSPFDWISGDPKVVDKYMNDKMCGFTFTTRTYYSEFMLVPKISGIQWAAKIPLELPIYIFSGDMDPITNYGEGQYQVVNWLWQTGHRDVTAKLYPGYRHEMLNEPIKDEVYKDILNFIEKHI